MSGEAGSELRLWHLVRTEQAKWGSGFASLLKSTLFVAPGVMKALPSSKQKKLAERFAVRCSKSLLEWISLDGMIEIWVKISQPDS